MLRVGVLVLVKFVRVGDRWRGKGDLPMFESMK